MAKIKKTDKVIITAGKDKGKEGVVSQVFPSDNKVIVGGLNMRKKHVKATQSQPTHMVEFAAPIDISNVSIIDPKTKKATRVGFEIGKDGKKTRIARKSGTAIK